MTAKHIQEAWDKLRDDRDALAAQVEVLREASAGLLDRYVGLVECGDCGNWNCETETQVIAAREALALPNTAAAILRQRDARTLREAADIADQWGDARTNGQGGHALRNYAARIRNMAAELERKSLRDMTESDFNEAHGA